MYNAVLMNKSINQGGYSGLQFGGGGAFILEHSGLFRHILVHARIYSGYFSKFLLDEALKFLIVINTFSKKINKNLIFVILRTCQFQKHGICWSKIAKIYPSPPAQNVFMILEILLECNSAVIQPSRTENHRKKSVFFIIWKHLHRATAIRLLKHQSNRLKQDFVDQ